MVSVYLSIFLFTSLQILCSCLEPFSTGTALVGVAVAASYASWEFANCRFNECCSKPWIDFNETKLEESMKSNLYGQHLAESTILKSLRGFLKKENPKKALAMSFHGPPGSGKNFVSTMIAESLYKNGMNSKYVHLYIANKDFPHVERVSKYQDQLRDDISKFTKLCERSLFIFDEVDKMPPRILDALRPYLDFHEHIDNVVYRKNIFVFLSNAGSNATTKVALTFWANGKDRDEITMKDIEPSITKGSFNERGGFQFSDILRSELIDLYVPFFPLEKRHVKKCIEAELRRRKTPIDKYLINEIASELSYFPPEVDLYSTSGCKRISQKIDRFLDD